MDIQQIIIAILFFYIPFHFSKKAKTEFFRLLYSFFGIYMLLTIDFINPIYNHKLLVGLGLLIPQVNFIKQYTLETIQTIKMMTANTYYFVITVYYKVLRFIDWVKSTFIMLKIFFTTFSFKKEDYYQEKQSTYRSHYNQGNTQQSYKDNPEYIQFFSTDSYIVLGVSRSDSKKVIKTARNELLKKYHTDKNYKDSPEKLEIYLEIVKNINNAWSKVEKDLKGR